MRAALYARVSTNAGQDPTVQLRELHELCERRRWDVGAVFTDVGVSGAQERRPQLDRLLADCRKRLFDVVVSIATTGSPEACVSWSTL
jgi:DNA invertase Pin-like site-specific DNA recombinase